MYTYVHIYDYDDIGSNTLTIVHYVYVHMYVSCVHFTVWFERVTAPHNRHVNWYKQNYGRERASYRDDYILCCIFTITINSIIVSTHTHTTISHDHVQTSTRTQLQTQHRLHILGLPFFYWIKTCSFPFCLQKNINHPAIVFLRSAAKASSTVCTVAAEVGNEKCNDVAE